MLRLGVIGLGSMGKNHARVISHLDQLDLTGISDINKKVCQSISKLYDTKAVPNYNDLIPHIDAAIVATPTNTHYDIAQDLIRSGKHVLIEKPITDSVDSAKKLIDQAKKNNVVLTVGHIERHNPAVSFVKDAIQNNQFGILLSLYSKRVSNFPGRIKDVGVIFDFGVHDIDIMRYLAGEVTSVYARAGRFNKEIDFEDHANIVLNFQNKSTGLIEVNWLTPLKIRKLQLTCSKNFVTLDYMNQSVDIASSTYEQFNDLNLYSVPIQYNSQNISLQKDEPLKREIQDFCAAIQTKKTPLVTGFDGMKAIEIAEAALRSYKTGKEIAIK